LRGRGEKGGTRRSAKERRGLIVACLHSPLTRKGKEEKAIEKGTRALSGSTSEKKGGSSPILFRGEEGEEEKKRGEGSGYYYIEKGVRRGLRRGVVSTPKEGKGEDGYKL